MENLCEKDQKYSHFFFIIYVNETVLNILSLLDRESSW
jgi:hypothetical protein